MRLICPNCDAQYEVADDAIPDEGRDVQCSSCGHAWYQLSPAALAAQAAEAELFDAPDAPPAVAPPAFEPAFEPAPVAEPEPLADVPPPMAAAPSRNLDEGMISVLREEAEREAQARAREGHRIETQGDLGLEAAAISPAARRIAQLKGLDPDALPEPLVKPAKGRDLLPDIEEINSTLRPEAELVSEDVVAPVAPSRRGFRLGFGVALLVAVLLVVLYTSAPRLAQAVPALSDLLAAYTSTVDAARIWLDQLMKSATAGLQG